MQYSIKKTEDFNIDSDSSKAKWEDVEKLSISNWPWHDYAKYPTPEMSVKCLYSENGIYVLFNVKERFILAKNTEYQGAVWQDSCVEFFAAPTEKGYFNFEINCIGTLLLHWNTPEQKENLVPEEYIKNIKIVSSLGSKAIETPVQCPVDGYTVECFLPFSFFEKYTKVSEKSWRANFFKCGDKTPEPSWGVWSNIIDQPKPSFHHPEYFGEINFE